jgi:hypothetical protein
MERMMRKTLGLCAFALLGMIFGIPSAPGANQAAARSCYQIWAQADPEGSKFRHTVYVENDCEYWLECTLWTDVDPRPPRMVTVGPGMTEHAETNARSDYDDPKGYGGCRQK